MTGEHASERLVIRYVQGDGTIPEAQLWALETHLETCAACRGMLADVDDPTGRSGLAAVWLALEPQLATSPAPMASLRRRCVAWLATWAAPAALSWLVAVLLVAIAALALGALSTGPAGVSLVLLIAPILPVVGVYASWTRAVDPTYELTAASPRAGLELVLRRTLAVLVVVIPVLFAARLATGTSLALALLPSLAFTATTLALGSVVGVRRAAALLTVVWAAVFIGPPLVLGGVSYLARPNLVPVWGTVLAVGAAVVVLRRDALNRLGFSQK
jgi:hypothetical protein